MPIGDLAPEITLLLAAIAALLSASFIDQRRHRRCAWIAGAGLLLAGVLCGRQLGEAPHAAFAGSWAIDSPGIWARLILLAAALATLPATPRWLATDRRHGEYYAVLLLATLGAMLMAGAADTMQLVVGILLSSITGYVLAAWHRDWAISLEAGVKFFLIGAFANTLLLLGVVLLFGLVGSTGYAALAERMTGAAATSSVLPTLALTLVVIGIGFELGAVPAHGWLPDVAQGAPAPAAAFLTVVPKIGAVVALARLLDRIAPSTVAWPLLIAVIATATMSLGNLAALWQTDLRRLLGWSSVSQAGYALMAVAVLGATADALPALLVFIAAYAAANLLAFAVVTQLRGRTALGDYRGLGATRPLLAAWLTLALLSLVGIPPLAGFAGKLTLFVATIDGGMAWLALVALVNTVVSLFYYLRVIGRLWFDAPVGEVAVLGGWAELAVWATGIATIGIGLAAQWLLGALQGGAMLR